MKKDAYYFPHFSNARNDAKIVKLRRVMGIEGYGLYFMLLEVLREQTSFKYPLLGVEDLAYEWHTSKEKLFAVISNFELFSIDEVDFFSPKQVLYLQPYIEKSQRAREAALKRWDGMQKHNESNANALPEQSKSNTSKVKESKVKESKVNNNSIVVSTETPTTPKQTIAEKLESKKIDFKRLMWEFVKKSDNVPFWTDNNNAQSIRFYEYWTEHSPNARKLRWEKEKAFDIKRRLVTWENRNYNSQNPTQSQQGYQTAAEKRKAAFAEADAKVNQMLLDRLNGKR